MEDLIKKFKKQSTSQLKSRLDRLSGEDLIACKQVLQLRGITSTNTNDSISIEIGDEVLFSASRNSKHYSDVKLSGKVLRFSRDPKTDIKYAVIKHNVLGTFHKQLSKITLK